MKPLVSILIPAYNAERWIGYTLESAIAQTWPRKEIIVVDDGSKDQTLQVAQRFASKGVTVVTAKNQGAAAARNHALRLCQGDYIQFLDADDLLTPAKIERQLAALGEAQNKRVLLSSPWAPFFHRTQRAHFIDTYLCQDLAPVEWLLGKMAKNLHMQTATWLTSRELAEAAGPWDTRLLSDDDGEYFCRVLMASEGTRFVSGTGVYYRITGSHRLSSVRSDRKRDALLVSMKLHVHYLRSMEDSERVREACLAYLRNFYWAFYHPDRPEAVVGVQALAAQLQGHLDPPHMGWKYAWLKSIFGWEAARQAQISLPAFKQSCISHFDNVMCKLQGLKAAASPGRSALEQSAK